MSFSGSIRGTSTVNGFIVGCGSGNTISSPGCCDRFAVRHVGPSNSASLLRCPRRNYA